MFWRKRKKHGLYYLLPGMTRANRRRRRVVFRWSIVVGLIVSVLFGSLLYYLNRP